MKNLLISFFILALNSTLFSQINVAKYDFEKLNAGFAFGFNYTSFKIETVTNYHSDSITQISNKPRLGLEVGGIFNYKISNHFKLYLTPLLSFSLSELNYLTVTDLVTKNNKLIADFVILQNAISLKYGSKRFYNHKVNLIFSLVPKYNYKNSARYFYNEIKGTTYPYLLYFKHFDLAYELGIGYSHFGITNLQSIELIFSYGFYNILQKDENEFTKVLNSLKANTVSLRFYFE